MALRDRALHDDQGSDGRGPYDRGPGDRDAGFGPDGASEARGRAPMAAGVCLAFGLSVAIPIAPEARVTAFDAVAVLLVLGAWRTAVTLFRPAMILLAVSSVAMLVSSYLNESGMRALIGREYQSVFLLIEMMGYGIILHRADDRGRAMLALGAALGICCHYLYPSDLRILDEPIKFLIGIPLGVVLLALYSLTNPRTFGSVAVMTGLMMAYALFCFFLGSRSIGGVYFVSALAVGAVRFIPIPDTYRKIAPLTILAAAAFGYGATELYTMLAINGLFGDRAAGIAAFQSSYGSILLGGRPEIIVNLSGIRDAPFFGVGILNYPSIYLYEMIRLSVYAQSEVLDSSNILYHSALFATAFESGIIAALFWGFMLYVAASVVPLLKTVSLGQRSFVMPLVLMTAWHILYSPPLPYNRFVMAIGLGFAFVIYDDWKQAQQGGGFVTDRPADDDPPATTEAPPSGPEARRGGAGY